jgi:hypothetical protein
MANAARAGTDSGTTSRQKIVKWSAPSILADSMIDEGREPMKLRNRYVASGRPNAVCASHTPRNVPFRLRSGKTSSPPTDAPPVYSRRIGMSAICSGTTSRPTTSTNST